MQKRSPIVLVTADRLAPEPGPNLPNAHGRIRPARPKAWVYEAYLDAVRSAGGTPIVVPPGPSDVEVLLSFADAVVLTGGDMDIHPSHYGAAVEGRLDRVEPGRTALELDLARQCLHRGVPVFGVCGGMQVLAVAAGGTLIQDLPPHSENHLPHEQATDPASASHVVRFTSPADQWFGEVAMVNSTHHQAVLDPGGFQVCGLANDKVVEAIFDPNHPFALGVQWHPELIGQLAPYRALVDAARASRTS